MLSISQLPDESQLPPLQLRVQAGDEVQAFDSPWLLCDGPCLLTG